MAELNRRARWAMEAKGKLWGPELEVGRVGYRAGDRIVTLAPGANGEIVTSERGTVIAVDVKRRELGATMDDGRFQRFADQDIDADHLAHGYAVTVHRSQGATVTRAHVLEDGGGRELAYVKMSRARECTTLYPVADSPEQATDDLARSWSHSRRIGWAIDAGTPTREPQTARTVDAPEPARLRHARLVAERAALAAVIPPESGFHYFSAQARVRQLTRELEALDNAKGFEVFNGTPLGQAATDWDARRREWHRCLVRAEQAGPRERHQLRKRAKGAAEREGPLRDAFERLAAPERARIEAELPEAKKLRDELEGRHHGRLHFEAAHPEALRRLELLERQIKTAAYDMDVERQSLDGIAPQRPNVPQPHRGLARERVLDRSIGLEL